MGRHLLSLLAFELFGNRIRVDWDAFVRIDYDTEQAGICLEIWAFLELKIGNIG